MGVADRLFGWDIHTTADITVGGINVRELFTGITLRIEADTMEARAVYDTVTGGWRAPRIRSRSWTLDLEGVIPGDEGASTDGPALFVAAVEQTAEQAVNITTPSFDWEGSAVISGGGLDLSGEAASQSMTLIGSGPPSIVLNPGNINDV